MSCLFFYLYYYYYLYHYILLYIIIYYYILYIIIYYYYLYNLYYFISINFVILLVVSRHAYFFIQVGPSCTLFCISLQQLKMYFSFGAPQGLNIIIKIMMMHYRAADANLEVKKFHRTLKCSFCGGSVSQFRQERIISLF